MSGSDTPDRRKIVFTGAALLGTA
ncbi:MAG: hypothetical protein QOF91_3742, partial [Alphaproteobacteria bacterium]|nr:hypothetical protein [Alphaproteobacteria bacterium]